MGIEYERSMKGKSIVVAVNFLAGFKVRGIVFREGDSEHMYRMQLRNVK